MGPTGQLLAHSNPERRPGIYLSELPQVAAAIKDREPVTFGQDPDGRATLSASAKVPGVNWRVFYEKQRSTALQPVYRVLERTALFVAMGVVLAVVAGILLARQMVVPIRALQVGAQQLEASDFGHRIRVRPGDEIADLADHFNRMADQLQGSYTRLEQKVEERTRELAQSVSEFKALEEIGRAVASSLDTKSVLATIVTRAVQLTQADAGAIYRYDPSRNLFELAEAHALSKAFRIQFAPLRSGSTKASWVTPPEKGARSRFRTCGNRLIFRSGMQRWRPAFTPFSSFRCWRKRRSWVPCWCSAARAVIFRRAPSA